MLDTSAVRRQFPILQKKIGGKTLCYLDSAATSQKPQCVLDAVSDFYATKNANVNRGVHALAEEATLSHDAARKTVQTFLNAKHAHEIIFTKNATEAINLVARSFGETLQKGDRIALSILEHHSNIVPWMQLAERTGIILDWLPITDDGFIDLTATEKVLTKGTTKLVAVSGLSNVLGTLQPLEKIIDLAHAHGGAVCIDASQLAAHEVIDQQKLDCDFMAFSGHKTYGPTGIGVLFGKTELLEKMPPFLGGGDMIQTVSTSNFTPAELPRKFEAGTVAAADAAGLAAALTWITDLGMENIKNHEASLVSYAMTELQKIQGLLILGPTDSTKRVGCISFVIDGIHPHDLTDVLGKEGVCLRAGHHCTQPLHMLLGIPASTRLSVAAYNTKEEIDRFLQALFTAINLLKK
ncbi:MAG: SufS family cysteine desulfurase [Candidatus Peribacteraceae bacterium]|nr:SufS family cysteine desulfurase [Candidatus Peribacteraceae bacterium]MBP9850311.1 SufS family cysteine desulfurase [Candidatus Peribacteraceae bacterium]